MDSKKFDVICIGAALVDMVAQVERHPKEDDEVFVSNLSLLSGGAAANTAYACAHLGLKTAFLGKLGRDDAFGTKIINDFKECSVDISLVKYSEKYNTGSAYVALNQEGDRRIYAHSGAANYLSEGDINEKELIEADVIYLSSLKNLEPFIRASQIGNKYRLHVVLNPGMLIIEQGFEKIQNLLNHIEILILSKREFTTLFDIQEISEELVKEKCDRLFNLGIKVIVVTMGEKGAFLLTKEQNELIRARKVAKIVDTTGAGDAFSAGFIYGLHKNLNYSFKDLRNNVIIGNWIAGKCIQKLGARNGIPMDPERAVFK